MGKEIRVGQIYADSAFSEVYYKVLHIAPKIDFDGENSYFVEMTNGADLWYGVVYSQNLKDDIIIVNEDLDSTVKELLK